MPREGFVIQPPQPEWGTAEDRNLHIVLVQPEIPGNTGNIGRLCAGTSIWLHLVKPLGFDLDNKKLRRAGLDYWPHVKLCVHESFEDIEATFPKERLYFFSTHATQRYSDVSYEPGSVLIFGRETSGLDQEIHDNYKDRFVLIPKTDKVRSLNLSNAAAVAVYEAMRQLDWEPMGL
jgi:tRNA (cytidine/uridine-2'-O-)-methyltransferase